MRKFAITTIALALATLSTTALADGNVFVNANGGASRYGISNPYAGMDNSFSKTGKAGALRVGYRWNSVVDYGFEVGYGFLGNATASNRYVSDYEPSSYSQRDQLKVRGWLLGGNLNYNIGEHWYVGARGGWFRARSLYEYRYVDYGGSGSEREVQIGTGEYFGVGGGYNVNQHLSLGLAYDTYRTPSTGDIRGKRIGMYSLQAEYRF